MRVVHNWKPCSVYSGVEWLGKVPEQESEVTVVFQTGFTGLTGCVLSFNPVFLSRMKKPRINADERRLIAIIHRKGREERKAEEQKSLRPLRSLRLIEFHGIPTAQGNKEKIIFQTGFTGSTGCVISFNQVHLVIMEDNSK